MLLALDRSNRRYDADGHLFVESCNIAKACVSPYWGVEIPGWQRLGLDANKLYYLYRDPAELARAAQSFAGKPLLMHHKPLTADAHPEELVIGAIGTDVRFEHPYLKGSLSVWRKDAIDKIQADEQRELSPGYRYVPDMTPGVEPGTGLTYDGVMRDIGANHEALVIEGRQGPDVTVSDSQPEGKLMRFAKFFTALKSAFPALTAEQTVAMDAALTAELPVAADALQVEKGVKHCVEDEFPDLSEDERKEALKEVGETPDDDKKRKAYKAAMDKRSKGAMDAAIVSATAEARKGYVLAADAATSATQAADAARSEVHALYAARTAVADKVGATALDSAEATYRFALDKLGVAHKDVMAPALASLYAAATPAAKHVPIAAPARIDVTKIFAGA